MTEDEKMKMLTEELTSLKQNIEDVFNDANTKLEKLNREFIEKLKFFKSLKMKFIKIEINE